MTITPLHPRPATRVLVLEGRLDSFGSEALQRALQQELSGDVSLAVLDMGGVSYLSSAALRVFLQAKRTLASRGGALALAAVQPYCRSVLDIAGFADGFAIHPTAEAALRAQETAGPAGGDPWDAAETLSGGWGRLRFLPGGTEPGFIEIAGDINDVLASRITPAHILSKRFSNKAYSIGLGGLGDRLEDYFTLMGEMITIGGTMVWLPCDGHDVPDFLIPKHDAGQVLLRTGFNASVAGPFHEYAEFVSAGPSGATMSELYRVLFDRARTRRPDFKGAIGLAMRAEMPAVFGSGIFNAPVASNAPANGLFITHPSNFAEWFEFDREPRHKNVTGLIAGCGIDLTADLSRFDREYFRKTFYLNPANTGAATVTLHNHVVLFSPLPMPARGFTLEGEIASVVENGDFIDMRHMLDASTVSRAVIGIVYAQDFRPDPDCVRHPLP